jgi:hypothetical protein
MHCPNCGKQTSLDQKFCRSCGMKLETSAKALAEHLSVTGFDKSAAQADEKLLLSRLYKMLLWGIIAFISGLALLAVGKDYRIISVMGLLIMLAGVLVSAYGVLSPLKSAALSGGRSSEPKTLKQSETKQLPPESFHEPIPTVTERTTNLLEVERLRKPE